MKKFVASFVVIVLLAGVLPRQASAHSNQHGGGANLGMVAVVFAAILIPVAVVSYFLGAKKEDTEQTAITEGNRTKREGIRAGAVLSAPRALGGAGNASYKSSEGDARIEADSALGGGQGTRPTPISYDEERGTEQAEEIEPSSPRRYASRSEAAMDPVCDLCRLSSLYDRLGATTEERRAVAHAIEEMASSRHAFSRNILRADLERLGDLYYRARAHGISEGQLAPLKDAMDYLEVAVFGRRLP